MVNVEDGKRSARDGTRLLVSDTVKGYCTVSGTEPFDESSWWFPERIEEVALAPSNKHGLPMLAAQR